MDRIEALETALAHLTRAVEDLSEVVVRQEAEIATLVRRQRALIERQAERELDSGASIPLADQRPPHW
ncbi:MAG: SlyX family protein [Gemmobacter sp.]|nr:SlyX family protein [Gemmobacter sp.]